MKTRIVATLLLTVVWQSSWADTAVETINGVEWRYQATDSSHAYVWLANPSDVAGSITVPQTVGETLQVSSVALTHSGNYSHNGYCSEYPGITEVVIPDGVVEIKDQAFLGCSGLLSVHLPDSLKSIGEEAFCSCSGLSEVSIPDGVETLGKYAFSYCYGLNRVRIGDGLQTLPFGVFYRCSSLSKLTFGETSQLANVKAYAFEGTSLDSVSFPDSLHSMDVNAFRYLRNVQGLPTGEHETQVRWLEFGNYFHPTSDLSQRDTQWAEFCSDYYRLHPAWTGSHPAISNLYSRETVEYPDDEGFNLFGALTTILSSYRRYGDISVTQQPQSLFMDKDAASIPYHWRPLDSRRVDVFLPSPPPHQLTSTQTWKFRLRQEYDRSSDAYYGLSLDVVIHWYWNWNLTVSSEFGSPTPAVGTEAQRSYRDVSCSVDPLVSDESNSRVQYQCIGWRGTGSVPLTGTGTNVVVQVKQDSTLEWQWATNFLIECSISGETVHQTISVWQRKDEPLVLPVETDLVSPNAIFAGDTEGVTFNVEARTVTIPADRPRSILARIDSSSKVFSAKSLTLLSGGDADWSVVEDPTATDGYCLRSGPISQGETSTVEMQVEESGMLSFDWKVSANRSDWAYFYVDGVQVAGITRATDWATFSTNLAVGSHELRWVFDRHAATDANAEAAFLDNVSWRPRLSLAVSSAYGTPSPAAGTALVSYGDVVSASVVAPAPANGTRRICTGWTGTGSVPALGTTASFPFVMTQPSTLVWKWRTDHWIDLSVVSGGTTVFQPQWIENGKSVSVSVVPDTHLFRFSLSGDTQGVTVSGTTIMFAANRPRTIRVNVEETKLPLSVESLHGTVVPLSGRHEYSWGDLVWCEASEPPTEDGIQYRCTGWRGTGSAPPIGYESQFQFRIEEPSSVFWQWQTNVCVSLETEGAIAVDIAEKWVERGTSLVVPFAPLADYVAFTVGGDSDGVVIDVYAQTITIPADRPRSVFVTATAMSLASALDAKGLIWTTSGGDIWIPQREVSSDGVDAAASGDATGGDNLLETSVLGPGTLSWFWKMDAAGWAGVDASVDGRDVAYLETSGDWGSASTQISGEGSHTVRFAFWTEEGCTSSDRAYLDRVSWSGATIPLTTQTTPEAVPHAWLDRWPDLLAENGGDYERAAAAIAANGINTVWECFVAGLDPTDPNAAFRVDISMDGGTPRIDWMPDLGAARDYRLEGRAKFGDSDGWRTPPTEDHRFFRARVALPDASGSVAADDAFPGFVTVTFDANGGTVEPESIDYTTSGVLGNLPTPLWPSMPFLGWYSDSTGGIRFSSQTSVPHRDTRLFARWNGFWIHFEPNGGTGNMPDEFRSFDTDVPFCAFIRDGYHFTGWAYQAGDQQLVFHAGEAIPELGVHVGETIVLHACWEPNRYVVRFDANGGTGVMDDEPFIFGEPKPLSANVYSYPGKLFDGWAESKTGNPIYCDGEEVLSLTNRADVVLTLYAIWSDVFFTVAFDANGGEGTMPELECAVTGHISLPSVEFFKAGHFFRGWSLDPGGAILFPDGSDFSDNSSEMGDIRTLYAVWEPNRCVFHFEPNGGTGTMPAAELASGEALPESQFERTGFFFMGWATNSMGNVVFGNQETLLIEDNGGTVSLYAVWSEYRSGLAARYFNISSSGYETWIESESAMFGYFADKIPILMTNTADWANGLDAGFSSSIGTTGNNWIASGMTSPNSVCSFHEDYASSSKNGFAIQLSGCLTVESRSVFQFAAVADDTVVLYIDGNRILANGSSWGTMATGEAELSAGMHTISIGYYESSGGQGLSVQWRNNEESTYVPVPRSVLFHRTGTDPLVFLPNGGNGSMPPVEIDRNFGGIVPNCAFSNSGKEFNGWALEPTGAAIYQPGAMLTPMLPGATGLELFATWWGPTWKSFLENGRIYLTGVELPYPKHLVVPEQIDGFPVTGICEGAFQGCRLTSITIPAGITSIGSFLFWTGSLEEVRISDLESWCNISFEHSTANPCYYASRVYLNNEEIIDLVIPNGVPSIGNYAFFNCSRLTSVTIPGSVTNIGDFALSDCSGLTSVTIPNSVTSIGVGAFNGCSGLKSISIPDSVTSIGSSSFNGCTGLERPVFNASRTILWYVPKSLSGSLVIPNGVTEIKSYAVYGCSGLTSIMIGNGVMSIGEYAFSGCSGLTSITIPDGVTSIGDSAFYGCSGLMTISIPRSLQWQTSNWGLPSACQIIVRD